MQPHDRAAFVKTLNGLAAIKPGAKLTPEGLEVYWLALKEWPLEEFKAAAAHLAGAHEFMPNPYHFEQLRKAALPTAAEAWERARLASGSAIQCGHVTHNGSCGDELIDRAVRGIGGYGVIAMCETDKLPFLERRFAEHYAQLQDVEDVRQAIPQIAGPSTLRVSGPKRAVDLLPKPERRA